MSWRQWNGAQALAAKDEAELATLRGVGQEILDASQREVPLEEGHLRDSGALRMSDHARGAAAILSYGGETAPYALRWHRTKRSGKGAIKFKGGRKSRYLQDPFERIAPILPVTLRAEMRERGF